MIHLPGRKNGPVRRARSSVARRKARHHARPAYSGGTPAVARGKAPCFPGGAVPADAARRPRKSPPGPSLPFPAVRAGGMTGAQACPVSSARRSFPSRLRAAGQNSTIRVSLAWASRSNSPLATHQLRITLLVSRMAAIASCSGSAGWRSAPPPVHTR